MKLRSLLFAMACPLLLMGTSAAAQSKSDLKKILVSALRKTKTPAMGAVIFRNGKITAAAITGIRRTDRPDKIREGDSWIIGSTGKPQTVAMIARLVDHGKLSWDTPLSQMLPELAGTMRPEYRTVTLIQLLSHHAGLPENISDMAFVESFFADRRQLSEQRLAYISRALQEAPVYALGTDFGYSNTGFLIAAVIAETTMGKSYEYLMRREVFDPSGCLAQALVQHQRANQQDTTMASQSDQAIQPCSHLQEISICPSETGRAFTRTNWRTTRAMGSCSPPPPII